MTVAGATTYYCDVTLENIVKNLIGIGKVSGYQELSTEAEEALVLQPATLVITLTATTAARLHIAAVFYTISSTSTTSTPLAEATAVAIVGP